MWFVYLDESKEDNKFYVYSALTLIPKNGTTHSKR